MIRSPWEVTFPKLLFVHGRQAGERSQGWKAEDGKLAFSGGQWEPLGGFPDEPAMFWKSQPCPTALPGKAGGAHLRCVERAPSGGKGKQRGLAVCLRREALRLEVGEREEPSSPAMRRGSLPSLTRRVRKSEAK